MKPILSIVIPTYNAANTIRKTLESIFSALEDSRGPVVEVLVVNDGSSDAEELYAALKPYSIVLIDHPRNLGMCASRNSGIFASRGKFVTILDADDRLVPEWPERFAALIEQWPEEINVCWSACVNAKGRPTVSRPDYMGRLTLGDLLSETTTGEYLPLFRGAYIRERGYVDFGTRKSCGLFSYLRFAQDGPLWISPLVLRIYEDERAGSVTSGWSRVGRAGESVICLRNVLAEFGSLYLQHAPQRYGALHLRLAVYSRLAQIEGAWRAFWKGARFAPAHETIGALFVLLLGRRFCVAAVNLAKNKGIIKRYG